ncbi:hypothetical protein DSO57_1009721 [Entomophthora muscae]|uniref:Uncharacterized protein n=1 Tax=Entomophthora muscae TaxID=34485 RepID=A0ACC2UGK7_9FUNG|nr:hypothetical protein DSO57_1009721 [Entomophthora muscae]
MTPPLTPQPKRPQESAAADESTSTQIFGVMYITLTGLIDSMMPTSGPWAILGKLLSYIVKLAPILWWALPAGPAGCLPASPQEPPTGWIPDSKKRSGPVMNDILILVLKTWELKPRSQGKPYVDQSRQETAQLPVGSNPGAPEIDDPKQGEQKPSNLSSVNTGGLKSTLETL